MAKGTDIAVKVNEVQELMKRTKGSFITNLGSEERFQKFLVAAKLEMMDKPALLDASYSSIIRAFLKSAQYDIMPGLGMAHLIPYKKKKKDPRTGQWQVFETVINFQLDYSGLRAYLYRIYPDLVIHTREVRKNDEFFVDYGEGKVNHKVDYKKSRGEIIGYYGYTYFRRELIFRYMTVDEIEEYAKQYSEAYRADLKYGKKDSPWSTARHKMSLKTLFIQVGKELPKEEKNVSDLFRGKDSVIIDSQGDEKTEIEVDSNDIDEVNDEDVQDVEPVEERQEPETKPGPPKKAPVKQKEEKAPSTPPEKESATESLFEKPKENGMSEADYKKTVGELLDNAIEAGVDMDEVEDVMKKTTNFDYINANIPEEKKLELINALKGLVK